MIKYLGSKRTLVAKIASIVASLDTIRSVFDVFSGTSRVGHALKSRGFQVVANDHLAYAYILARCYVQADASRLEQQARGLVAELNQVAPSPGYVTKTFCEDARYFQPKNGARIDAIRQRIADLQLESDLEAVALTSLIEAADRVDSTTGVQMAYLKSWAPRAWNDLELRLPAILPGSGRALHLDALEAARQVDADVAYLDPPYNQHSYLGNYHIWETIVRWDHPEAYGVARKRLQCRDYSSPFNSKRRIHAALQELVDACRTPVLLVSFNNEGYVTREEMERILTSKGYVYTMAVDFKRYVGAQIGIYNPSGKKVGRVSHLRNTEYLYLVAPNQSVIEKVSRAVESSEQAVLAL